MALAGADGKQAADLLRTSVKHGAATLGMLAEAAVKRLVEGGKVEQARRLFTDEERQQLADALAATNATAEMLGRARIRRRLEQAEHAHTDHSDFSESATDFTCFADRPLHPLAPRAAVEWFRRLIPGLKAPGKSFADAHQQAAFTLAATTDETLLGKIKGILSRVLETGENASKAPKIIAQVLDDAGVSPKNPQYAEMVYRTNMMEAYNAGSHAEMQDPDVRDSFPVWRYEGIRDGRQGSDHEPKFGRYYPNDVSFAEVRGPRPFNCRCTSVPVYVKDWQRLQAAGASVSKFSEVSKYCMEGENAGKPGVCPREGPATGELATKPASAAARPHVEKQLRAAAEAIVKGIPPEKRREYLQAVHTALQAMPPGALARLHENMSGYQFHPTARAQHEAMIARSPGLARNLAPGKLLGGGYHRGMRLLSLDGAARITGGDRASVTELLSHEYGHAIDGPKLEISSSPAWKAAFAAEIAGGGLSEYAKVNEKEGLAELARLRYGSGADPAEIERRFPRCVAVWKEHGIW